MKTLYITSKPVYPKIDGGCVAMASYLDVLLQAGIIVDHLTIETDKHPFIIEHYPVEIRNKINPLAVYIDTRVKPLPALKYIFAKGSYNVSRFHSKRMCSAISEKLKSNDYDFVILDSLYVTTYIDLIRERFNGNIYLRSHNSEAQIWYDLAVNEKNIPKTAYFKKLARDLEAYERTILEQLDGVMALSPDDLRLFNKMTPNIHGCVIPITVEVSQTNVNHESNSIFHIGSMDWIPNREAVEELISIFPEIQKSNPGLTLHVAGTSAMRYFNSSIKDGIEVHGYVEDLKKFSAEAGIMVSPIRSGSGVRVKILEMMAMGIPVVTTPVGAKGIFIEGRKIVQISESRPDIIATVNDLLKNKTKREVLGEQSKKYIREFHSIETASNQLLEFIQTT